MDLRCLRTFQVAAQTLSFTQAAAALHYAQSSVTAQMKGLEEALGVPLFDRVGNRLRLTEPGQRLVGFAGRLLALAEEAKGAVRAGAPAGALTLTAPETVCTYLLPPVLAAFTARLPSVELRFLPMPVREFKRALLEGSVDVAFLLEEDFPAGGLRVERLRPEPLAVVSRPGHALAARRSVTARDLVGERVLLTGLGCSYRNRFERALIQAGAHPRARMEFESVEAIKRCVAAGMGVAALPAVAVAAELAAGTLAELRWRDLPLDVATHLAWNPGRWPSPALQAFTALTIELLAAGARPGGERSRVTSHGSRPRRATSVG